MPKIIMFITLALIVPGGVIIDVLWLLGNGHWVKRVAQKIAQPFVNYFRQARQDWKCRDPTLFMIPMGWIIATLFFITLWISGP